MGRATFFSYGEAAVESRPKAIRDREHPSKVKESWSFSYDSAPPKSSRLGAVRGG